MGTLAQQSTPIEGLHLNENLMHVRKQSGVCVGIVHANWPAPDCIEVPEPRHKYHDPREIRYKDLRSS